MKLLLRLSRISVQVVIFGLFLLAALVAALHLSLDYLVDRNRERVSAEIRQLTGIPIEFGELRAVIFPRPGVVVEKVSIPSVHPCMAPLNATSLSLWIGWRTILARKIVLGAAEIDGLHLSVDPGSQACHAGSANRASSNQISPPADVGSTSSRTTFGIERITLRDAFISLSGLEFEVPLLTAAFSMKGTGGVVSEARGELKGATSNLELVLDKFEYGERLAIEGLKVVSGAKWSFSGQGEIGGVGSTFTGSLQNVPVADIADAIDLVGAGQKLSNVDGAVSGDVSLTVVAERTYKVNSKLSAANLKIVGAPPRYSANKVDWTGSVTLSQSRTDFAGNANVSRFVFDDGVPRVFDTDATLSNIKGAVPSKGPVSIALELHGTNCRVSYPAAEVSKVNTVDAPLKITVGPAGAYSVAGPVTAKGVNVKASDRLFNEMDGVVDLLVSSDRSRFASKRIGLVLNGVPSTLSGEYGYTAASHDARDLVLTFDRGTLRGKGSMARGGNQGYSFALNGDRVDLGRARTLLGIKEFEGIEGTLDKSEIAADGMMREPLASMRGRGSLFMSKPDIAGFDFTRSLRSALSVLPGVNPPSDNIQVSQTAALSFEIANSTVSMSSIDLRNERYNFHGTGALTFAGSVDVAGTATFLEDSAGAFGLGIAPLRSLFRNIGRLDVPVTVKGPARNPSLEVQVAKMVSDNSGLSFLGKTAKGAGRLLKDGFDTVTSPLFGN